MENNKTLMYVLLLKFEKKVYTMRKKSMYSTKTEMGDKKEEQSHYWKNHLWLGSNPKVRSSVKFPHPHTTPPAPVSNQAVTTWAILGRLDVSVIFLRLQPLSPLAVDASLLSLLGECAGPCFRFTYLRGWGRRNIWAQEFKASMGNIARLQD